MLMLKIERKAAELQGVCACWWSYPQSIAQHQQGLSVNFLHVIVCQKMFPFQACCSKKIWMTLRLLHRSDVDVKDRAESSRTSRSVRLLVELPAIHRATPTRAECDRLPKDVSIPGMLQ
jgi:hypothetical protein